jgi:3',5'-cyclic AMP phosphodiesterase CpdA
LSQIVVLLQGQVKDPLQDGFRIMLIAHISDSHIEIPEPVGAGRLADFEKVIGDINLLEVQPDLVIHTGDISHCDRKLEYRFAKSLMDRLHGPFKVIPGNKDGRENIAAIFGTPEKFTQYAVEHDHWRLLFLDTLSPTSNKGAYCPDRLDWLKDQLSGGTKPTAIFMHHPTFEMPELPYPFQFENREMAEAFEKLIVKFDQVKGVFCGHAHRNTQAMIGTIPAMTLTAMSLDRRKGPYPAEMDGKPVYQMIDLKDDGTFTRQLKICR